MEFFVDPDIIILYVIVCILENGNFISYVLAENISPTSILLLSSIVLRTQCYTTLTVFFKMFSIAKLFDIKNYILIEIHTVNIG